MNMTPVRYAKMATKTWKMYTPVWSTPFYSCCFWITWLSNLLHNVAVPPGSRAVSIQSQSSWFLSNRFRTDFTQSHDIAVLVANYLNFKQHSQTKFSSKNIKTRFIRNIGTSDPSLCQWNSNRDWNKNWLWAAETKFLRQISGYSFYQ